MRLPADRGLVEVARRAVPPFIALPTRHCPPLPDHEYTAIKSAGKWCDLLFFRVSAFAVRAPTIVPVVVVPSILTGSQTIWCHPEIVRNKPYSFPARQSSTPHESVMRCYNAANDPKV